MRLPSPLYVILDRSVAGSRSLDDLLDLVLAGGGRLIQLREKTMPAVEMLPVARRLARRCREVGALFIVNDRADIAVAADAHGLHVGQGDMPAREARALLRPGMVLGVSTHDEDQAGAAVTDGADYVAVGSIFPTTSRVDFQLVGTDLIRRVRSAVPVPLVAIGGITVANAAEVIQAGADGVAVISAICANRNPEAATRTLLERLRAARGPRPAP
ncbi:MAG TPA: thiamine phosphate synthase [Methylomirabilota bacterium]